MSEARTIWSDFKGDPLLPAIKYWRTYVMPYVCAASEMLCVRSSLTVFELQRNGPVH